jgi:hypothetical protein
VAVEMRTQSMRPPSAIHPSTHLRLVMCTYHPLMTPGRWVVGGVITPAADLRAESPAGADSAAPTNLPPPVDLHLIEHLRYRRYCNLAIWRYRIFIIYWYSVLGW